MATDLSESIAAMILERKTAREKAHAARRESKAEFAEQTGRRRRWGLERRHATKLARSRTA